MTPLCAFLLLLLTSSCRASTTALNLAKECESMGDIPGDIMGDIIRMVDNVRKRWLPIEFYHVVNYFWDHVDWSDLEGYSIPEASWKKGLVGETCTCWFCTCYGGRNLYKVLLELVEEESRPPVQNFSHYPVFRAPDNVQDLWLTKVSLASDVALHFLDKINMVLNRGIFSTGSHRLEDAGWRMDISQLELLRQLSDIASQVLSLEPALDDFLAMARDKDFQESFEEEVKDTLVARTSCLYSYMAARNLTLFNTFMDVLDEQHLAQWVIILVEQTFMDIHSQEAEQNVKAYIAAAKFVIKNTDFDQASSKLILSFLRARSLVLAVDVEQVVSDLDSVHESLARGWWRLSTGQWPQLIDFISTFMAKTLRSPVFWAKVQEVYLDAVAGAKSYYQQREKLLEETIRAQLGPLVKSVTDFLKAARVKSPLQDPAFLTSKMREVDLISQLTPLLDHLASSLTSQLLSCYTALWGKLDLRQLGRMMEDNSLARLVREVVKADWPEKQEVPAGLPEFVETLQEQVLVLVTSGLGLVTSGLGGCRDTV